MKRLKKTAFTMVVSGLLANILTTTSHANNLAISAPTVSGMNITFTVSWNNSWYTTAPNNWDAAWLFVKYKDCNSTNWQHASLSSTATDHVVVDATNYQLETVSDAKGIFLKRKILGTSGNVSTSVTLKLNIPAGTYNFKVFGIEMVKVTQDSFYLGDGAAANGFNSITILSEDALTQASLGGTGTAASGLPAAYPKGYAAFYCMKYEITQEQYVDFLNTLTYDQQVTHSAVLPSVSSTNWAMGSSSASTGRSRNGIKIKTTGLPNTIPAEFACDLNTNNTFNEASDGQNIACNYMSWTDLLAYLDWAALRPMTDLEYEKICRGPSGRVGGEYVWGSNTAIAQATSYNGNGCNSNLNTASELASLGLYSWPCAAASGSGLCAYGANAGCDNVNNVSAPYNYGPLRVGFTATASTNRITAGASYYGAMDMGGNVWERVVATNSTGATYTGTFGDGTLDATGNATNADWPSTAGAHVRGGSWYVGSTYLQTSNRSFASTSTYLDRNCQSGGRGLR